MLRDIVFRYFDLREDERYFKRFCFTVFTILYSQLIWRCLGCLGKFGEIEDEMN